MANFEILKIEGNIIIITKINDFLTKIINICQQLQLNLKVYGRIGKLVKFYGGLLLVRWVIFSFIFETLASGFKEEKLKYPFW